MLKYRIILTVTVFLFAGLPFAAPAAEKSAPRVVVTISPLHALTTGVMDGIGQPALLIPGGHSPHGAALRPSQAATLAEADLVVWVGPELESRLSKAIANLASEARVLRFTNHADIKLLPSRSAGGHDHDGHGHQHKKDKHDHAPSKAHADKHGGEHSGEHSGEHHEGPAQPPERSADPHLWLDPGRAVEIIHVIAETLAEIDPENAQIYTDNRKKLTNKLLVLNEEISGLLRPLAGQGYIVAHDAYQYIEDAYGLRPLGIVAVSPHQPAGAASLQAIRQTIAADRVSCLFTEAQFSPRAAQRLIDEFGLRTVTLDPLGLETMFGAEGYFTMMRRLAGSMRDCLSSLPNDAGPAADNHVH